MILGHELGHEPNPGFRVREVLIVGWVRVKLGAVHLELHPFLFVALSLVMSQNIHVTMSSYPLSEVI